MGGDACRRNGRPGGLRGVVEREQRLVGGGRLDLLAGGLVFEVEHPHPAADLGDEVDVAETEAMVAGVGREALSLLRRSARA